MSQGSLSPAVGSCVHHEIYPDSARVPLGKDRVHWRGKKQHVTE